MVVDFLLAQKRLPFHPEMLFCVPSMPHPRLNRNSKTCPPASGDRTNASVVRDCGAGIGANSQRRSRKDMVIGALFEECQRTGNFVFHNNRVKEISKQFGFGNPFDATKLDNKAKLPAVLVENDYGILHIGGGKHRFIKGIDKLFHDFEEVETTVEWPYKQSRLNQFNSSESNILSVANNQRILHHFLFGKDNEFSEPDILQRPKTYFPHRTKDSFDYNIGDDVQVKLNNIQIEIDLTLEFKGDICVFEAKNGKPDSFSIYQIYHPFRYYHKAKVEGRIRDVRNIFCVYVVHDTTGNDDLLTLWKYTFSDPNDMSTIQMIKSTAYKLIRQPA
ncbi:MAG: hypothetical protein LBR07_07980 [Puniceicoccales bacterium]|nr:hypothetical protein [Puniceicoccales bacterium]